ncbi:hypothetical protein C0Q70_08697 [Pomacea canaliculata]|uniref:Uncharacterized protein n=1 Tax=Pomacea canaliculata TaxID=400727 RepID=A0A2T7P7T5_POMCA|nr:hypothetical protein C0Q70_08697 [Pomacea canaliculata]
MWKQAPDGGCDRCGQSQAAKVSCNTRPVTRPNNRPVTDVTTAPVWCSRDQQKLRQQDGYHRRIPRRTSLQREPCQRSHLYSLQEIVVGDNQQLWLRRPTVLGETVSTVHQTRRRCAQRHLLPLARDCSASQTRRMLPGNAAAVASTTGVGGQGSAVEPCC